MVIVLIGFGLVVLFLKMAYEQERTKAQALILIYISISLLFGGVYYLIYVRDKSQFVFTDEITRGADVAAAEASREAVDNRLENMHMLDAFILSFLNKQRLDRKFRWGPNAEWNHVDENWDFRCYTVIRMVGPQKDIPVYTARFDLKVNKMVYGLAPGSQKHFEIKSIEEETYEIEGGTLISELNDIRNNQLNDLRSSYSELTAKWQPFELWDFYYFSFTIIGAADIVAARTPIRLLVVLHILTILGLAALREQHADDLFNRQMSASKAS